MEDAFVTFSGYIIAVLSAIFAVIQLRLKHRAEKENLRLQHQLERTASYNDKLLLKYQEHLRTINALAREAERNVERSVLADQVARHEYHEDNDPDAIFAAARHVESIIEDWQRAQLKQIEDLNDLKLFADDELAVSLDHFIAHAIAFVDENVEMATPYVLPDQDETNSRRRVLREIFNAMSLEKRAIERLMRRDVRPSA